MKKIYEKVMGWFRGIGIDKYWHFIAGLVIAALFNIAFGLEVCILPVIVAGFAKEAYDFFRTYQLDWWDLAATILGGLVVQVFVYL